MEPNSSFFFFFFFFFLLPLGHCFALQVNLTAGNELIEKVCQHSPHSDICMASLRTDPNSGQADMEGLALIALKVAHANATDTSQHIAKLLNNSALDPFIEQCLTDCSEQYLDAVEQIEDSLVALTAKGFHDVDAWVKAAIADVDTCEQGFKEKPDYESMLTHRNIIFKQLCNNALAIIHDLQWPWRLNLVFYCFWSHLLISITMMRSYMMRLEWLRINVVVVIIIIVNNSMLLSNISLFSKNFVLRIKIFSCWSQLALGR